MKSQLCQLAVSLFVLSAMSASAATRYVDVNNAKPTSPYTDWASAATAIQDAVDAAVAGDRILVTDGVYETGGRAMPGAMTNRVTVDKPVTLQSVNGAAVTVIRGFQSQGTTNGDGAIRCVYLANGAALVGFTLINGATRAGLSDGTDCEQCGGGVWCESGSAIVSHSVLTGNSAFGSGGGASGGTLDNCTLTGNSAGAGGGASGGTLARCVVAGNSALYVGGGTFLCTVNNCALTANEAGEFGGGADGCTLNNCTLTGNSAYYSGGGAFLGTENNCILFNNALQGVCEDGCDATPGNLRDGSNWSGNPLFVDYAAGNLRLQSNSPCINAGSNASASAGPDLDGNPRLVGGTVDIGAYEFQFPHSRIPDAWLQRYGLPTDGSADDTDLDADGLTNEQEWQAGTDPTTEVSVLRLLSLVPAAPGVILSWQSVSGRMYVLERRTALGAQSRFDPVATHLVGQPGTTSFIDTKAVGAEPCFYRVGVEK